MDTLKNILYLLFRLRHRENLDGLPTNKHDWYKAVFITSDVAKGYYNKMSMDSFIESIPLSKQKLWTAYLTIHMQKTSCFRKPFSDLITKFHQHGLVRKWVLDYTVTNYKLNDKRPQVLRLEHIQGIFYMCFGLYVVACLIFLCEVYWQHFQMYRKRQNRQQQKKRVACTLRRTGANILYARNA